MTKPMSIQKKTLLASFRVLKRSLISVVLTQAKTAHLFLDPVTDGLDDARRKRDMRTATNVVKLIDDILMTLEANREQRAEIKKARDDLAERLKNLGQSLTA